MYQPPPPSQRLWNPSRGREEDLHQGPHLCLPPKLVTLGINSLTLLKDLRRLHRGAHLSVVGPQVPMHSSAYNSMLLVGGSSRTCVHRCSRGRVPPPSIPSLETPGFPVNLTTPTHL